MARSAKPSLAVVAIKALGLESAMSAPNFAQDAMFSEARAYERFMGRWSRQLAPLLVRFAGVRHGDALLDVGSATGALSAALVTAASAGRIGGPHRRHRWSPEARSEICIQIQRNVATDLRTEGTKLI